MGRRHRGLSALLLVALATAAGCRTYEARERGAAGEPPASAARSGDPFEEAKRRVEEARSFPVPAGNYRIDVERVWFDEQDSSAINAVLRYIDDNIDVRVGEPAPDAGFRVGVAKGGFSAAIDGHLRSSRDATREQVMLTTVPGYAASIAVGETRYAVPFQVGGVPHAMLVPEGQFVGTSLDALVEPAGDGRAIVELTPVFSALGSGGETVRLTQATTRVVVPLGAPLLIGSHDSEHDSVATSLLSRRTSSGTERAVLVLTVTGG